MMYGKAGGKEHVARRVLGALLSDFPEETRKAIDDDRWAPTRAGKEMKRRKLLDLIDDESVAKASAGSCRKSSPAPGSGSKPRARC